MWSPLHRSLLAAALREYAAVERARDTAIFDDQQEEDTSLWDDLVLPSALQEANCAQSSAIAVMTVVPHTRAISTFKQFPLADVACVRS